MKIKMNPTMMTNRELFTAYQECKTGKKSADRYSILGEMTKRINRKMITPDVVSIFSQYKLNGAGDQRY
jgi:hypothetical protein